MGWLNKPENSKQRGLEDDPALVLEKNDNKIKYVHKLLCGSI